MALISSIRKRSWILILFIGLGLAAFIMMDMFNSNTGILSGNRATNAVGSINGKEISWNKLRRTEEVFYRGSSSNTYGLRDQLWNYYLEKSILSDEGSKLGINVGEDELKELMFGTNLSPVVQSIFRNPQTGQVDLTQLNSIRDQIQSGNTETINVPYMEELADQVKKVQMQNKYTNLFTQGLYTPSWMAEQLDSEKNTKLGFNYVKVPFSEIDDSAVTVSDSDLNSYLSSNKATYNVDEETRVVDYVVYDVFPTAADSAKYKSEIRAKIKGFRAATNDSTYVIANGGVMSNGYAKKSSISPEISNRMTTLPIGSVVGPYVEGTSYKLAKIVDRKQVADSVRAEHILVSAIPNDANSMTNAISKIDSLKTEIENGASFTTLAQTHSEDSSSNTKGGDLGYFGIDRMISQSFSDLCFYQAKEGELRTVFTQFGMHLVRVKDKKFTSTDESVKIAYLNQSITPSEETQSSIRETVQEFVNNNTSADALATLVAADPNLKIVSSSSLKKNDFNITGLGQDASSRELVRWAFNDNTSVNNLSPDYYIYRYSNPVTFENYDSKYVIASLKDIQAAGMPSLENIKSTILPIVRNEKKSAMISSAIAGKTLDDVASQYTTSVSSLSDISASSTNVPGLGNEPKVIAALMNLDANQKSAPILGENGVFIVELLSKNNASSGVNLAQIRRDETNKLKSIARTQLMESLKDGADITDNRFNLY